MTAAGNTAGRDGLGTMIRRFLARAGNGRIVLGRVRRRFRVWPPVGLVRFGSLRRLSPISRHWGFDRGLPIDRYYIERFLADHAADITGSVLEIADDSYTRRFGVGVTRCDVLHPVPGNPQATIVADLTAAETIASDQFDCIVLTQTLHLIYDLRAAVATLHRILKPGGTVLATLPGITKISRYDAEHWGDYWRFTAQSGARVFADAFTPDAVQVRPYGNVLAAAAFLYGLAADELSARELNAGDPDFDVVIGVRARKSASRVRSADAGPGAAP